MPFRSIFIRRRIVRAGTNSQTVSISTPITNTTYLINGAVTGVTVSGLPAGITGSFTGSTFLISGTPTVTGTFNYTITPTGGCGTATAAGTNTVNPGPFIILSSAPGSNNQSICSGAAIVTISYSTGGGVTGATVTGLPAGLTGIYSAGIFTISGTPAAMGTFNYTVTTSGGSGPVFVTGTIVVSGANAITMTSAPGTSNQSVCINSAVIPVTYSTANGVTGVIATGLPAGITGTYSGGTNGNFVISGTGTSAGTYSYTVVTTSGGCSAATATGTITVNPNTTLTFTSAPNTNNQTVCVNTAIINIAYVAGNGATGVAVTGLPAGVTAVYSGGINGVFTISGSATTNGVFNYTATTAGGCGNAIVSGTITVTPCGNPLVAAPNPTTGTAHLSFYRNTTNAQRGTVSVYNSRGTRLMLKEVMLTGNTGTMDIDLGTSPAGVGSPFLVRLKSIHFFYSNQDQVPGRSVAEA